MEKIAIFRSVFRSFRFRSYCVAGVSNRSLLPNQNQASRSFFNLSSNRSPLSNSHQQVYSDCGYLSGIGSVRFFSADIAPLPAFEDPKLQNVFKDLMAVSWDNLPDAVVHDSKAALSRSTNDNAGKEVVENVFRAAEAVEEFGGMLMNMKMEIDDSIGLSGENVKPVPNDLKNALRTVFDRYTAYLDAFGPSENYLRKKVEMELGSKMIHLKMRCSDLGSEWGKVTVLGTSGLSGSYVEQRA